MNMLVSLFLILPLLLSASHSTPTSELATLMAIKASLDPQNQVLTSWTDTPSADPCGGSFEGIACNEWGHVANISLQGKGLSGRIPSALRELTDLTGLYLHFNALSGEIPREIGSLSKLTDLYLDVNNLSGGIPTEFGNMSNLQVLQLCYNKLSGSVPTQLGSLKKLTVLALQYNHLTGAIPASLGELQVLTRLDLSFNSLFGPIPVKLANAQMLQVLDLRNNTLTGNVPPALRRLNSGFQYQNNPGLCGFGFPNLEACHAADYIDPSKPEPLGPDSLSKKNIPQSANLTKPDCQKPNCRNTSRHPDTGLVFGGLTVAVAFIVSGLFAFSWYRRRKQKIGSAFDASENRLSIDQVKEVRRRSASPLISLEYSNGWDPMGKGRTGSGTAFSREVFESFMFNLEDVERATQSFLEVNLLGRSSFSAVYKGILRDGSSVAVKRIAKTSCKSNENEFVKGLKLLTALKHENLVTLRGFCCSKGRGECFLISEFVPNGNLLQFLDVEQGSGKVLEWSTRISVIKGIAEGIFYLHRSKGKKPAVIHQNISAEKVLLDHWNNPLLADSGLHRLLVDDILFSKLKSSAAMGYLAPEYTTTGRFTDKSDIYAFGVLVFQILSGKTLINPIIRKGAESGKFSEFIDPNLEGSFPEFEAERLSRLALLCTHDFPSLRPSMEEIVKELSGSGWSS
ncbi:hypothetical protein CDL15_Pgr028652 [Punica granatum]|uniref:Protein kinase domain-containing protein n=2 Tax=Punica granatum TaxID=22663 RepID=A0A218VWI3_PUNGR|nr:hypothetical protein CDL15_Pgr028652 [Punica granatum]